MFYSGIYDWERDGFGWQYPLDTTLNIATSPDGLTWTKDPDNPIDAVALVRTPSRIGNIAAQVVGPRIHLWIGDHYAEVGGQAVGYFLYEPGIPPHP